MVKRISKKLILTIVIIVAVVAVAATVLFVYRNSLLQLIGVDDPQSIGQGRELDEAEVEKTITAVNAYVARGDSDTAVKVLDQAIKTSNSNEQKASLYQTKAGVLAGDDVDGAIEAMEQAVAEQPNFGNTSYLGDLYERTGDYANAAKYYKLAAEYFASQEYAEDGRQIDGTYYEEKAAEMEAKL